MPITDSFNRANETPLASPWSITTSATGSFNLSSNTVVQAVEAANDTEARYVGAGLSANQYAQAKITESGGGAGSGMGVMVRKAPSGTRTFIRAVVSHAGSNNVEVLVMNAGSGTTVGSRTTTWVDGDVLRLEVTGVSPNIVIKVFKNGTQLGADFTGVTGPDTGEPGLAYSSTSSSASADDFEAGSLSGPLNLYLADAVSSSWQRLTEAAQSAATIVGGWVVSTGTTNHSAFEQGTERAATTFADTTPPDGSLDTTLHDAFRSENPYTGTFESGDWVFHFVVRAVSNGGSQDGRVRFRLFKADADGSNATEITSGQQQGSLVSNVSTSADFDSTLTVNPGQFSISNQYLFVQLAWERTGAGGMTTSDINFRTGSSASAGTRIVTSSLTISTTSTVDVTKSALYRIQVAVDAAKNGTYRVLLADVEATKSGDYRVQLGTDLTQSGAYRVQAPVDATETGQYRVFNEGLDLTESALYGIGTADQELTRTALYRILAAAPDLTETALYRILAVDQDVTRTALYRLFLADQDVTRSALYQILTSASPELGALYRVQTSQSPAQSALYRIIAALDVLISAGYRIHAELSPTKDAEYVVQVTGPSEITRTAVYRMALSVDIQASGDYRIVLADVDLARAATYRMLVAPEVSRSALYHLLLEVSPTKAALYSVLLADMELTRSAAYRVLLAPDVTHSALYRLLLDVSPTKAALYSILVADEQARTAAYRVLTVGAGVFGAEYVVTPMGQVQLEAAYRVLLAPESQAAAVYRLLVAASPSLAALYHLRTSTGLEASAEYVILAETVSIEALRADTSWSSELIRATAPELPTLVSVKEIE